MTAADQATEQVADVVEKAADVVSDVVEQQGEVVGEFVRNLNGIKIQYAAIGVAAGVAAGAIIGYVVADKRLQTKYEKIAEDEISQMREHFREKEIARQAADAKDDALKDRVEELGYAGTGTVPPAVVDSGASAPGPDEDEPKVEIHVEQQNVFVEKGLSTEQWNHDKEVAARTPDAPYVIHKHEFAETEFETTTLTYYVEDDVLADVADKRMTDIDTVVGLENLEKFGHGSEDANVVYIRNDRLRVDFEILRSGGSFTAEVLGQEIEPEETELRHSADMRRRRPRYDDEAPK